MADGITLSRGILMQKCNCFVDLAGVPDDERKEEILKFGMVEIKKLLGVLCLVVPAQVFGQLAPKKFLTIPLGKVRPVGWLMDQIVTRSRYETDDVSSINGMVPNGVLVNDAAINAKTSEFLSYVLSHQDSTGWLGPEVGTNKPRYLWGRYPFFFGAIQMIEVDPSLTDSVVTALYKFVTLANSMLKNGEGVEDWTATRWEDFVITLQWLYDNHPNGQEALLIDTMKRLKWSGVPWEKVFSKEYFPTTAGEEKIIYYVTLYLTRSSQWNIHPFIAVLHQMQWHGVNLAEGLKALPATYRFTQNQSDLDMASSGWDLLFQYHGRPSGIYAADEYLAGLEAIRGTELCLVVVRLFIGSYLYQVIGDPKFADRVERITYNALPATLTGSMWSRQYLQEQNQIAAKNMTPNPFPNDGPYSNVFGLEPNYPCCTVNHPQGWPKFITNAFLTTPDNLSLVHIYLGPFSTSVTLGSGNQVTVNVDTLYPFSDTLNTTITATSAFTYYVRIPSWVINGTISINGRAAEALSPSNGLQAVAAAAGTTTFVLNLPAEITTESRPHGSIAVHRGPLHYAFDIARNQTVLARNAKQPLAVDLEFDATAAWQYAIDPSTLKFSNVPPTSGKLPSPIFDSGMSPLSITVTACPITWEIAGDTFAAAPPTSPACTGGHTTLTLTPFGTTKLRIGEFPVFKST
ncbi:hypothetical protein J132_03050 [Termitomyces sp. J132]|nr:hypothetical protein J132_03050 [Termitomyces sp. J132]